MTTTLFPNPDPQTATAIKRGRAKLFLGYAPGVGKTYAMLSEANRRKAESGQDVVVGIVDCRNRTQTAEQIGTLEVVPKRAVSLKSGFADELDLARVIARKPEWVIIDDLPHVNAPGLKNRHRYEDVIELLDAGINVMTAMNVLHLESLNDTITRITGVHIRETVPDTVLQSFDEIVTIDVTPRALAHRLERGEIYGSPKAPLAMANFYTDANLSALRDLSLRTASREVTRTLHAREAEDGADRLCRTTDRILVCLNPSEPSDRLLRRGWRIATVLHGDIIAAWVPGKGADSGVRDSDLRLATDLGISVVKLPHGDIAEQLAAYAAANGVTEIVIGHSERQRLGVTTRGAVVQKLIGLVGEIDVLAVANPKLQSPRTARPQTVES